jgi:LysM repeat protein
MWKSILYTTFLLALTLGVAQAQFEDCLVVVDTALQAVGDLCGGLDRSAACYGSSIVESTTFFQPRPEGFFVAPGDRAELLHLREIRPLPLDEIARTFGVAVLNVEAKLPETIPGQAVLFLLMGDARLTNETSPGSSDETPFQSFYFLPSVGKSNCYEAEPMLTIQSPGDVSVTITLNGVETEMSPGTLLTITSSVCTIHRGNITQRVGDETAVLEQNQTVDIAIDDTGKIIVNNLRGISEREYIRGWQIQQAINALAAANDWPEQSVILPEKFDLEPENRVTSATDPSSCDVQHTVSSGETLHRIAQRYDTSVLDIAEANGLSDPRRIYAGQVLCIPNPGSGFEPLPAGQ